MFSKIFRKVPAALIVVPMIFASLINSFIPQMVLDYFLNEGESY